MKVGITGFLGDTETSTSEGDTETSTSNNLDICRSGLNGFRKVKKIGFGTYGDIQMAIHRTTNRLFALKKFRFDETHHPSSSSVGIPRSAIREIRILRELTNHENIVDCYGLLVSTGNDGNKGKGSLYMVLGFVDHDLVGLLELHKRRLTIGEIKSIMSQVFSAIDYCHMHGVVHRDLKCANILIDKFGVVKLADFGLAREFCRNPTIAQQAASAVFPMTNKVITIWYRPPELLLGATEYGCEVDMWSMGAILGELLLQKPLFSADEESRVLSMIIDEIGFPQDEGLMYMKTLPLWKQFTRVTHPPAVATGPGKTESAILHACSRNSWDIVSKLLSYAPSERLGAGLALEHAFFSENPSACEPGEIRLPMGGEFCHGLGMKEKRERERQTGDNGQEGIKKSRVN